ncbi:MAG: type II and III secretion system protein [Deltaproteobacteria bacterium]|nr:type II and III secretion system protein [Candidatus Anaeroferrophillacea bacterium]
MKLLRTLLFAALAAAPLLGSGCAGISPAPPWNPIAAAAPEPPAPALAETDLSAEKPLFRIIGGTAVDGSGAGSSGQPQGTAGVAAALPSAPAPARPPLERRVELIQVRAVPTAVVVETLTDLFPGNVIATPEAQARPITVYVRDVTLRQAIEAICRLNDLWYREEPGIVTLMTTGEYANEMVVRRHDRTRSYNLRYANAVDLARIVQALMGSQVHYADIGAEEAYGYVEESSGGGGGGAGATTPELLTAADREKIIKLGLADRLDNLVQVSEEIGKPLPAVITVFKRNNCILARSLDDAILTDIGHIIEALDTPTSQVLLELRILQVNLDDGFESFFQFDYKNRTLQNIDGRQTITPAGFSTLPFTTGGSAAGGGTLPGGIGLSASTLQYSFINDLISARLEFYAREGRLETLATPFLMSANNSTVEFFVGEEIPLREDVETKTVFDDEGNVVQTLFEFTVEEKELGTDVVITSFINDDGTITMNLEAEISNPKYNITQLTVIDDATGATLQFPLDGTDVNEIKTIITAQPEQSLAIGGIIRENVDRQELKVPLLGDVPLLGNLFKKRQDLTKKTETIIVITPHVISHPDVAGKITAEFLARRSSHSAGDGGERHLAPYPTPREPKP